MTKLVQPNVLRTYQSGEQYAINELVLYNSVPAYTNTALAQGVAGTATDFNPVSKANIPAYASDTVYAVGDLVRDATEFKNVYECGIAHTGTIGMTAANWIPVGTRRIRITGSGAGSYAAGTWYSPVSAYGTMYQTHVTLDGGITSFNLNYGVGINEEVTVVNATGSDITFTMPSSCFWLGINGGVATAVLASGESFIFTKEGYNLLTHIVRVRRTKPYFNANGFRLSNANSETLYTSFVSNLTAARTLTLADADVNLGSISTSSIAGATFVYTAGMGSVTKTLTAGGATFDIDALETNRAHSFTVRNGTAADITCSFVTAKTGGLGSGLLGEDNLTYIGSYSDGAPLTVTLKAHESWEITYGIPSGNVVYFATKKSFTPLLLTSNLKLRNNLTTSFGFTFSGTATVTDKVITLPNANVDLGNLSSVATTNNNVLGGTDCRIEGGTNNNVSGTRSSSYMCQYHTITGTDNKALFSKPTTGTSVFTHTGNGNTYFGHRHTGAVTAVGTTDCSFYGCNGSVGHPSDVNVTYTAAGNGAGITYLGFVPHTQVVGGGVGSIPLKATCMLSSAATATGVAVELLSMVAGATVTKPPLARNGGIFATHLITLHAYDINQFASPRYAIMLQRKVDVFYDSSTPSLTPSTVGTDSNPSNLTYTVAFSNSSGKLTITATATDPTSPVVPPFPLTYKWYAVVESTYF